MRVVTSDADQYLTKPASSEQKAGLFSLPSYVIAPCRYAVDTGALKRRSRSELVTTKTELKAIAPAANIGFSRPTAAIGMPIVL